jgi:hypothetical protein
MITFAVLQYSCDESTVNPTKDISYNKLTIQNDPNWVEVTDTLSMPITCLDFDKIPNLTEFVVRDSIEYSKLKELQWFIGGCNEYKFPEIDFNIYSLLGFNVYTGFAIIKKSVFKNVTKKEYLYLIKIQPTGDEKILISNRNFILIPKISDEYIVKMDTIMSNYIK